MGEMRAPFGIDIATTLVGSGLTLFFSALVIQYGDRIQRYSDAELYQYVGIGLFVVGLLLGVVFAAMRR